MSIKSAPYYWIVCDRCGNRMPDYEFSAWDNPQAARDEAQESDWVRAGGADLCWDCSMGTVCNECERLLAEGNPQCLNDPWFGACCCEDNCRGQA